MFPIVLFLWIFTVVLLQMCEELDLNKLDFLPYAWNFTFSLTPLCKFGFHGNEVHYEEKKKQQLTVENKI